MVPIKRCGGDWSDNYPITLTRQIAINTLYTYLLSAVILLRVIYDHSKVRNTSCSVLASVVGPFLMPSASCWACFGSRLIDL